MGGGLRGPGERNNGTAGRRRESVFRATDKTAAPAMGLALCLEHGFDIDAQIPGNGDSVLFPPKWNETVEVPEITTSCWEFLDIARLTERDVFQWLADGGFKQRGGRDNTIPVLGRTLLPYSGRV